MVYMVYIMVIYIYIIASVKTVKHFTKQMCFWNYFLFTQHIVKWLSNWYVCMYVYKNVYVCMYVWIYLRLICSDNH